MELLFKVVLNLSILYNDVPKNVGNYSGFVIADNEDMAKNKAKEHLREVVALQAVKDASKRFVVFNEEKASLATKNDVGFRVDFLLP